MSKNTDALNRASIRIIARLMAGLDQGLAEMEAIAKSNCPVDEGILRASIGYAVSNDRDGIRGRIGSNRRYAVYVHQGTGIYAVDGNGRKTPWVWHGSSKKWAGYHKTVGQRPQPFLKNAVEQNKSKLLMYLKQSQEGLGL